MEVSTAPVLGDKTAGATLGFCGGLSSTSLEFIICVNDLATLFGADIIVDDLGFFLEPYFEDGPVADTVRAVVDSGVMYVSAAGNNAEKHYEGLYVDSGDGVGSHQIGIGNTTFDVFGDVTGGVVVQWSNPFGVSADDYDLCFVGDDPATCATYNSQQDGDDNPIEVFPFFFVGGCDFGCIFQVRKVSGSPQELELFVLNGGFFDSSDIAPEGSLFGHSAVPGVLATAAISATDPGNDDIEPFSSHGPAEIFFPSPETRQKPDISAIDNVSITGAGGFPSPFLGTSAAAPHVAGAAALLMGGFTTPQEIIDALQSTAIDLGVPGIDNIFGAGRLDALAAAEFLNDSPQASINSPVSDVTILQGETVNFQGTCSDPNSTVGATFLWNFGVGSGISNSNAEDPGSVVFSNTGTFSITFTCADGLGVSDDTPASRTVTVETVNQVVEEPDDGDQGDDGIDLAGEGGNGGSRSGCSLMVSLRQFR